MKKFLFIAGLTIFSITLNAQVTLLAFPASEFPTFYWQRTTLFQVLPQSKRDIIFLGNSITNGSEWAELFSDSRLKNRGISGDTTEGVMNRLKQTVDGHPAKIFLMIGTNDLARGKTQEQVLQNILLICQYIKENSPKTKLYVQSILPVNDQFGKFADHTGNGDKIDFIDKELQKDAVANGYTFIDLHTPFSDATGKLNPEYTNDGLHMLGKGYLLWKSIIEKYVK